MKYLFAILFSVISLQSYSQHGIGIPNITGDDLFAANSEYTAVNTGIIIYVTASASAVNQTGQTINVDRVGHYYYDGTVWQHVSSTKDKLDDWTFLVTHWNTKPVLNTGSTLTTGRVYDYVLNGVTRYRFVPNTYDAVQDAFYANFDGTNLTNQITTRNQE